MQKSGSGGISSLLVISEKKNISDDYYDHFSLFFPPWRQRVVFYFFPSLSRKEAYCHHHLPLKSERTEANLVRAKLGHGSR